MRRGVRGGVPTAAVLALAVASPGSAQVPALVQHIEPPRAPGVSMPAEGLPFAVDAGAPLAGLAAVPGLGRIGRATPVTGSPRMLVIPALFSDSPEPTVSPDELRRVLFDGPSAQGTFTEFYAEVSRGLLTPLGTVTDWVRTDVTLLEAAGSDNGHGWIGPRVRDYVRQAVDLMDDEIDYGAFDNDGPDGVPNSGDDDGFVDAFAVEFLEIPGSCGGPGIWPHRSALRESPDLFGVPTDDLGPGGQPIRVGGYITQGVTDCSGVNVQGPNVIAHEFGHLLGLPDLYQAVGGIEPQFRHWNVGCFGLMAAGSWGCGSGGKAENFGPTHLSAPMKERLGWIEVEEPGAVREAEFVLEPAQTTGRTLRMPMSIGDDERLWIEFRPMIGFDRDLPAGGVIVYHEDLAWNGRQVPPGLPPAKLLHLIEADGDHALRRMQVDGGNRGVAEDVFGVGGRNGPLHGASSPARLFTHEGLPVPITIHSVVVEGGVARVVLSTHRTPAVMAVDLPARLDLLSDDVSGTLRIAGGALPYSLDEPSTLPAGLSLSFDGTTATLTGTPLQAGDLTFPVTIVDALGTPGTVTVSLRVDDVPGSLDRLLEAVVSPSTSSLPPATLDAFDDAGNRNGQVDVGDLRAHLRRN